MTQDNQPREWRRDGENIVDDSVHSGHEIAVLKRGASDGDGDLIAAAPELLAKAEALLEKIGGVCGIETERRELIQAIRKAYGEA